MKTLLFLFLCCCALSTPAQVNVELLHQLVAHSKSEHEKQQSARDQQLLTTANEKINTSMISKMKSDYRQIQSRFSVLGSAIDVLQIGISSAKLLAEISQNQTGIIALCKDSPVLIPLGLAAQVELVDRSGLLLRYIYGLALSIGPLNQMSQADRKMLFSFVLTELESINGSLRGLKVSLSAFGQSQLYGKGRFASFLSRDQALVEQIINHTKALKK